MKDNRYSSVWNAIEPTVEAAENMKLRSALLTSIREHVKLAGLTQTETADLLKVSQPRVSDLMRGKISLFSLDMLVNMATAAGLTIELNIHSNP